MISAVRVTKALPGRKSEITKPIQVAKEKPQSIAASRTRLRG